MTRQLLYSHHDCARRGPWQRFSSGCTSFHGLVIMVKESERKWCCSTKRERVLLLFHVATINFFAALIIKCASTWQLSCCSWSIWDRNDFLSCEHIADSRHVACVISIANALLIPLQVLLLCIGKLYTITLHQSVRWDSPGVHARPPPKIRLLCPRRNRTISSVRYAWNAFFYGARKEAFFSW